MRGSCAGGGRGRGRHRGRAWYRAPRSPARRARSSRLPRPLSFLRRMRVVSGRDFARAYKTGTRARGAILLVVVAPNGLEYTRLGLSVGKSIWKGAVERNRIRRVFREAFRLAYPELPAGVDVVMIPAVPKLVPALEPTRAELLRLVARALERRASPRAGDAGRAR